MIKLLYKLDRLKFKRSPVIDRLLIERGMIILMKGMILMYAIFLGLYLDFILAGLYKAEKPIQSFFRIIPYYFYIEFALRYFFEKTPTIEADKYLHLPIPKMNIVRYLLGKSFISYANILAIVLFLPFVYNQKFVFSGFNAVVFLAINILLLSWINHWFMIFIKTFKDSFLYVIIGLLVITGLAGLDYFEIGSFNLWISKILETILPSFWTMLILITVLVISYLAISNKYVHFLNEDSRDSTIFSVANNSLVFLSKYGLKGQIAEIEWKLILRHKKSKKFLQVCFFGLLYGFYFYNKGKTDNIHDLNGFELLFPALFTTGFFMMNFGQLFLSWNTSHFDFYISKPSGLSSLIQGKMVILLFSILVMTILSTPHLYFGGIFLAASVAAGLFNAGIIMHIIVLMSLIKPLPMDINNNGPFNYEGIGCAQYLMMVPTILGPLIVFSVLRYFLGIWGAVIGLGVIGAIGLMLFPFFASLSIFSAESKKYTIGENFRNKKY